MCISAAEWFKLSLKVAGHNRRKNNRYNVLPLCFPPNPLYIFQCRRDKKPAECVMRKLQNEKILFKDDYGKQVLKDMQIKRQRKRLCFSSPWIKFCIAKSVFCVRRRQIVVLNFELRFEEITRMFLAYLLGKHFHNLATTNNRLALIRLNALSEYRRELTNKH